MFYQSEMVKNFKLGMFMEFFQLWDEHLSDVIKQEMTTQKLEFKLNVYFAVYALLNNSGNGNQVSVALISESMCMIVKYI